jgi:hypothetical protein
MIVATGSPFCGETNIVLLGLPLRFPSFVRMGAFSEEGKVGR